VQVTTPPCDKNKALQVIANTKGEQMKQDTVTVAVRLSRADHDLLSQRVGKDGKRMSDIVRRCLEPQLAQLRAIAAAEAKKAEAKAKRQAKKAEQTNAQ
jgi:hypothetical protein